MKIRVVTDSACDLPDDIVEKYGIEIVPLTIRFGEDEFVDRFELSAEAFYDRLATSDALPETAAPAPGKFQQAFEKLGNEGADAVICVNISSGLSATMESAQQAAKSVSGDLDVRVIDSQQVSGAIGRLCIEAADAADAGTELDTIVADLEERVPRTVV